MLSPIEREEIRQAVYEEMADLEDQIVHQSGSFTYLCRVAGRPLFTHHPMGRVMRQIHHDK